MRERGLEPLHRKVPDPKSGVSANFTTLAVHVLPLTRFAMF